MRFNGGSEIELFVGVGCGGSDVEVDVACGCGGIESDMMMLRFVLLLCV